MIFTKSLIKVEHNKRSFDFLCDADCDLLDIKSALMEMLIKIQCVIDDIQKSQTPKKLDEIPDTEMTL